MKGRRKYSPDFREQVINRTLSGSFVLKPNALWILFGFFGEF
ncbi:hypothetical protein LEP1GSC137_4113 [Leptospira borgpetersenii str. Noumea 25]|uniref:Transposase n=1 Tax=Leptospira borgpetersenii serovar Ballum TaxID=280505 RepID=A0A0S2ITZ3_LEPBO|nr:hypothetical protein LBBP_02896 [Leptospira borgpetersenii serovar Ballum]EKQ99296.1 hypothetical protein LEP1GSC121_2534 [Leptospira borgpetersenii serovar Castellonis str. 200801910]EMO11120.1 hypothetical protein LEP1GSC137_4113 [Leptospira borgpetersenii str. Noumea 25]